MSCSPRCFAPRRASCVTRDSPACEWFVELFVKHACGDHTADLIAFRDHRCNCKQQNVFATFPIIMPLDGYLLVFGYDADLSFSYMICLCINIPGFLMPNAWTSICSSLSEEVVIPGHCREMPSLFPFNKEGNAVADQHSYDSLAPVSM